MKEIVQQYGFMILAGICVLGVFTILFAGGLSGGGILSWIGAEATITETTDETISISQETIVAIKSSQLPTLTAASGIVAGTAYYRDQLFSVVDTYYNQGDLRIIAITDSTGADVTSTIYNSDTEVYTFAASGIYSVKLTYWDEAGASDLGWVYLCVN